jgi:hypothetical protein
LLVRLGGQAVSLFQMGLLTLIALLLQTVHKMVYHAKGFIPFLSITAISVNKNFLLLTSEKK